MSFPISFSQVLNISQNFIIMLYYPTICGLSWDQVQYPYGSLLCARPGAAAATHTPFFSPYHYLLVFLRLQLLLIVFSEIS